MRSLFSPSLEPSSNPLGAEKATGKQKAVGGFIGYVGFALSLNPL
jgi:hypothetical protein